MSAKHISDEYNNQSLYPHIILDDFLDPTLAKQAALESRDLVDDYKDMGSEPFTHENQIQKFSICDATELSPALRLISSYINGNEFMVFLRKVTRMSLLRGDPSLRGGGLHFTRRGGKLDVHHDFNFIGDSRQPKAYRKCNLIIFLNETWEKSWGGNLELWDKELTHAHYSVPPRFNRAVLFNIEDAPHGHPHPLECPITECRRSLAYYFYDDTPVNNRLYHRAHWKSGKELV